LSGLKDASLTQN